jgi:hypothetical protein
LGAKDAKEWNRDMDTKAGHHTMMGITMWQLWRERAFR